MQLLIGAKTDVAWMSSKR